MNEYDMLAELFRWLPAPGPHEAQVYRAQLMMALVVLLLRGRGGGPPVGPGGRSDWRDQ